VSVSSTGGLNEGTMQAVGGSTLSVSSLTNYANNTLTNGTYYASGTLKLPDAIQINAATIILDGSSSAITTNSGSDALAGIQANAATGSFTIQNGRNFTTAGSFDNAGILNIGSGSAFTIDGFYHQLGNGTVINNGKFNAGVIDILEGGILKGSGLMAGNVSINGGTVEPGNSPGNMTIDGNYSQSATGKLLIELDGLTQGVNYDWLYIKGSATLGGLLDVDLYGGYTNNKGDNFTFLTADGGMSGLFKVCDLPYGGQYWEITYGEKNVKLAFQGGGQNPVPVPAASWLLGSGFLGLFAIRRRFSK